MLSNPQNNYKEFKNRFKSMSDSQLIDAFNSDVGKSVWISAREQFHRALREEFDKRKFDYLASGYNINRKIILSGKKITIYIEEYKIPAGLYKCDTCSEYKGKVRAKDLNWEYFFNRGNRLKSEEMLTVTCLCDGMTCSKCKKNKIHRPISNSYDPRTNTIGHWPWFSGWMRCWECRV